MIDREGLSFPPVELAPEEELARAVHRVPLVRDAVRLAGWAGARRLTGDGRPAGADAAAAAAELGLDPGVLPLVWDVAAGQGLLAASGGEAGTGPGIGDPLEFWDGVVTGLLRRGDLTGSPVIDEHLAETLAAVYAVREGVPLAVLADGLLHAHRVACGAAAEELGRLRAAVPGELARAVRLLEYCGIAERSGDAVRLTPLGVWAVRRDLLRAGHDAPSLDQVAEFAEVTAAELVDAMLAGKAPPSAVPLWLARRAPEAAARELIAVASSGNAAQRGTVGTILEELGPEAEPAVRAALDDPMVWRYAAAWLGVRELPAPALGEDDGAWVAVDTLAALRHLGGPAGEAHFDLLGEDLLTLIPRMGRVDHPDVLWVLDTLGRHHPDPLIAKAARKAAMKARSRPVH